MNCAQDHCQNADSLATPETYIHQVRSQTVDIRNSLSLFLSYYPQVNFVLTENENHCEFL